MSLRRIRIQHLGVIEEAELELTDGLNVITGETGAGKTMLVSGLGLLLGERADPGLVRAGASRAVVEGEVEVAPDHPAAVRAQEAGGDVDEGLILVRTVAAQGRSRASVGGRSAPVSVLSEVGHHLVAVHGQADQWRLRDVDQHRVLLDVAGGDAIEAAMQTYTQAWQAWQRARQRLRELTLSSTERGLRADALRLAVREIERVDPHEGEEDELRAEADRLTYAEELRGAAQAAHDALVGSDPAYGSSEAATVSALLATAAGSLSTAADHDPELAGLLRRVEELSYLASDLAPDLASYTSGVEVDPERLDAVHARRAEVSALLRRYGATTADVLALGQEAALELAALDVSDEDLAGLHEEVATARVAVGRAGAALSESRRETARRVGEQVTHELAHLAMGSATVTIEVTSRSPSGTPGPGDDLHDASVELPDGSLALATAHGIDAVEIRLAANPGAPARSVTRAASGGELSRVMLALELVCGDPSVPTYVFDEVDAGVGGAAALSLGGRLARLAGHAQVIVVTHLGQVAAYADRHLVVRKSIEGQVTRSGVVTVEGAEREAEIARMLGGIADSDAALEHARELLARRATMDSA